MLELSSRIRGVAKRGFKSVAAPRMRRLALSSPRDPGMVGQLQNRGAAAGWRCALQAWEDAPPFSVDARKQTFRVGLFGLTNSKMLTLL